MLPYIAHRERCLLLWERNNVLPEADEYCLPSWKLMKTTVGSLSTSCCELCLVLQGRQGCCDKDPFNSINGCQCRVFCFIDFIAMKRPAFLLVSALLIYLFVIYLRCKLYKSVCSVYIHTYTHTHKHIFIYNFLRYNL